MDGNNSVPKKSSPTSIIFIIISIFLLLVVIGLGIWIFFLYRKPPCTANATLCNTFCQSNCTTLCPQTPVNNIKPIPYIIYGTEPTSCLTIDSNSIKGILGQNSGSPTLQLVPVINDSVPNAQWYFIPTTKPNEVIIQNVGSGGYININTTNSAITVQSGISNATSLQWNLSKSNNIDYFVFNSPVNNGCPNNSQYMTFQNDNTIKMSCLQSGVTGQWWFISPITPAKVG